MLTSSNQLDSAPAISIEDIISDMPKIHHGTGVYGLEREVLDEICARLEPGFATLETGMGLSTFVFLLAKVNHTVVTPDSREIQRMQEYCQAKSIATSRINFICESSHLALPKLPIASFDLILIDGCHGIPMVQVDYLFSALALKTGGTLVLDDIFLSSVRDLLDFLKCESSWRLDGVYGKTAFLTKLKAGEEILEWDQQSYVVEKTSRIPRNWKITSLLRRSMSAARMLLSGNLNTFYGKLRHQLLGSDNERRL